MAKKQIEERKLASLLYVEQNFNQKEVAAKVGVSLKTINEWAKEENWDTLRISFTVTRMEQIKWFQSQISEIKKRCESRDEDHRIMTPAETDQVIKLAKSINALESEANVSEVIQSVMNYITFIKPIDLDFSQKAAEYADMFLKSIVK